MSSYPESKVKFPVADRWAAMGSICEKNGQFEEAVSLYRQALSRASDRPELRYHLGWLYYKLGNLTEAIAQYRRAIAQNSNLPKIHYNLGVALQDCGEIDAAMRSYRKAIEVDPLDVDAHNNLGGLLVREQRLEEAVKILEIAISKFPGEAVLYLNLGQAFLERQEAQKAVFTWRRAIGIEPENMAGYYHLGRAWQHLGKHRLAAECFERVLQLKPDFQLARYHRSYSLIEMGRLREAIAGLKAAIATDNPWVEHYCNRAKMLTGKDELERSKQACADFLTALKSREKLTKTLEFFAKIHLYMGDVMVEYGEPKKGESHYHKALLVHPDSSTIYLRLGYCLSQQGRDNAARFVYQIAGIKYREFVRSSEAKIEPATGRIEAPKSSSTPPCDGLNCRPCLEGILKSFEPRHLGAQIYRLNPRAKPIQTSPKCEAKVFKNGRIWVVPQKNDWMVCNAIAVWDGGNRFVPELSRNYPGQLPNCQNSNPHKNLRIEELPQPEFVAGTVAVLSGLSGNVYFHWMVDILPRFDILRRRGYTVRSIDRFLINSYQAPFQKETLLKLGIPLEKIIESDRHPHIRAERLLVPSFPDALGWPSPQALAFHRRQFLSTSCRGNFQFPTRIYISRNQSSYRQVVNENEAIACLKKYGFVPVALEALSVERQAFLFANAEAIVAPHGSGLTNLMFCRPGTTVIELVSPHYIRHYYWVISQQLGLHHYYIKGEAFDCYPIRQLMYPNPLMEDVLISIKSLEKMMNIAGIQKNTMVSFTQLPTNRPAPATGTSRSPSRDGNESTATIETGSDRPIPTFDPPSHSPPKNVAPPAGGLLVSSEDLEVYFRGAETLYHQGQYEQVVQACQRAIAIRQDARTYKLLGNARQAQGQVEEAKRWYAKAIQLQPDFADVFSNLGTIYAHQKQWQEAIACYQKAIALQPKLGAAYRNLARAWTQLGQMEEATECWYHAYSLDGEQVSADDHLDLATNLMEMGLVTRAISSYCRAIESDPNSDEAYHHLGEAMKRQQYSGRDASDYQENLTLRAIGAVRNRPSKPRMRSANRHHLKTSKSQNNRGFFGIFNRIFSGFGGDSDLKSAAPEVPIQQTSATVPPPQPQPEDRYQQLSDIWIGEEAENTAVTLQISEQLGVEDYLQRAELAAKLGNLPEAAADCRRALELQPDIAEAYKILGQIEQAQVHRAVAQSYYEKAIALGLEDGEVYLNLGSLYAYQKQWHQSIQFYHKALDFHPKSALIYWNLAKVWRQLNREEEVAGCLYEAYSLEPDKVKATEHFVLGNALLKQGQITQAIACYHRAIERDENLNQARQKLAEAERRQKGNLVLYPVNLERNGKGNQPIRSEDMLATAPLKANETDRVKTYIDQAESHLKQKEFDRAVAACEEAVAIAPNEAQIYKIWGNALQGSGDAVAAREKYERAIELNPDFAEVHVNLGSLYGREGRWDVAIKHYQRAIELKPNLASAHRNLARIWKRLGKVEAWAECWNRARELEPGGGSVAEDIALGNAWAKSGNLEAAIGCYGRAIQADPSRTEIYDNLGEMLLSRGRWQDAIAVYQKGIENHPGQPEFYGKLGQALAELQRWDDALLVYRKAVKLNPDLAWVHHDLADLVFEQGQTEEAISHYQKVVELEPENWEAHHSLGDAYQQREMLDEAVKAYERASALAEKHRQQESRPA
ncbi:tetratricopeptide repeat protein [Lyngbya sp. CCY1209]|uniref:tetratricopeptide repeat protein n=1 Tax=Lyngbya sp. CCY1209 TaxID=2886103 RepID=UPI002D205EF0|nr:tetratricopeptide repeat protein [Lyngbya sp. CCY1209]MEB3886922.1 tetratricopeptide repeat protein [Lyngbya sp. CCY1209]